MPREHWPVGFEDRYGAGSYERLTALFDQPCVTFAEISSRFGVTRERVRQWHLELRPNAPRGHARRRVCLSHRQKRRLFDDALFRTFYRHVRPHIDAGRVALVRTRGGYARRLVQVAGRTVALKRAGRHHDHEKTADKPAYVLMNSQQEVDYIYFCLGDNDYLFLPKAILPQERTTFLDSPTSKYQHFRNTFAAIQVSA